jgi:hypothetical protein
VIVMREADGKRPLRGVTTRTSVSGQWNATSTAGVTLT